MNKLEKNMNRRILTCVFCGHEYPQDTPAHGNRVLTEHIKVCDRHPMRKSERDIAMLRAALVGLIGADTDPELRQMEATIRLLPAPEADKAVSINAIHALLATMTPNMELINASEAVQIVRSAVEIDQENKRLRAALERIAKWEGEFPETGRFWDEPKNMQPMSYAACYGSNGERDYMRQVAQDALTLNDLLNCQEAQREDKEI